MKIVPLVTYVNGNKEIVGEVRIDTDGNLTGIIKAGHPILQHLTDSANHYSFVTDTEPATSKGYSNGVH